MSFQTGVTELYNEYVSKGVTPTSTSLAALKTAVTNLYNKGTTAGYNNGRSIFIDYTWSGWTNSAAGIKATKSIDITSNYSKYSTLTTSNFRVYTRVFNGSGGSGLAFTIDSYNPSNGVVVIATTANLKNPGIVIIITL